MFQLFTELEFRSTPPREGRPDPDVGIMRSYIVSIHAPTRGATTVTKRYKKR